jgi:hypothetical protein
MNLTIELSERGVRDGVVLVAAYHFLLAIATFLGSMAIFVYAILPAFNGSEASGAQNLFLPILGAIVGLFLAVAYVFTAIGLLRFRNTSRMAGIFLSLFGIVIGLFCVLGGIVGSFNQFSADWMTIGMVGIILSCGYTLLVFLDLITLIYLLNGQVRAVFYGEEWLADAVSSINNPRR